ncbi:hypothetical protein [Celeribacter sp.]|uniref:hypothetical protein n=1 Tax=Celeribacter sp. TaxID=1890673 RepID=UPI003A95881F
MPNAIAYLMLFIWPAIAWGLFRATTIPKAIILTIVLGYLFLPVQPQIDLPLLPAYDKDLVPALSAALFAWLYSRKADKLADIAARRASSPSSTALRKQAPDAEEAEPWRKARRKSRLNLAISLLILMLFIGLWLTYRGNREPLVYAKNVLVALTPYDFAAMSLSLIVQLLPFWIARRHLGTRDVQISLLRILVFCSLGYSLLALIEVRLSPQLNTWIYGFFPHEFVQHIRGGSFRPIVFLSHGLRVGMFLSLGVLSAAILARLAEGKVRLAWLGAMLYLFAVLYLSRNLGAVLITTVLLPVVLVFSIRMQILATAMVSTLVLFYPIARGANIVPVDRMVEVMQNLSPQRAQSFETRLNNEAMLIERANLKPLAGWGGWGRARIYNEEGRDISIVDGTWINVIGQFGWMGYLGQFGLLCLPAYFVFAMRRRLKTDLLLTGPLILVAANLVDLIPNSSGVPPLWMMAGALWTQIDARRTAFNPDDLPRRLRARGQVVAKRRPRVQMRR